MNSSQSSSSNFKKLQPKPHPKPLKSQTKEESFWSKFRFPILLKQYAAVTSINFSPSAPFNFAVTSSSRVLLFDHETNENRFTLSRFKGVAYGATYRQDGKLIIVGGEIPHLKLFDPNTKSLMRIFKGHTAPVHVSQFSYDNVHIFSAGDDKLIKLWDVASEQELASFQGHEDYIRCATPNPSSTDIWITGSYDHKIKMWDLRTQEPSLTFDHGDLVQSVVILPGGSLVASSGGNYIKIWDLLGRRLLQTLSNHQKVITSLAIDGEGSRLISGGLDHHLKVYDLKDYSVIAGMVYPAPILCLGIAPDNSRLVVGMSDGMLSIKSRPIKQQEIAHEKTKQRELRGGTYRYFVRGRDSQAAKDDYVVSVTKKAKLADYDKFLKNFQYKSALDAAIKSNNPDVTLAMFEELETRGGLTSALSGRDEETLDPILQFLINFITKPRYASMLIHITERILDLYSPVIGESEEIDSSFGKILKKLKEEIAHQKQLFELLGSLDLLLTSSSLKGVNPIESSTIDNI